MKKCFLSTHHHPPSCKCTGGCCCLLALWPRILTHDTPFASSSPDHHWERALQGSRMMEKSGLNLYILHPWYNIPWLDKLCVCDEFAGRSPVLCSPMYEPKKEGGLRYWAGPKMDYFWCTFCVPNSKESFVVQVGNCK